jgi:hypothetical protein
VWELARKQLGLIAGLLTSHSGIRRHLGTGCLTYFATPMKYRSLAVHGTELDPILSRRLHGGEICFWQYGQAPCKAIEDWGHTMESIVVRVHNMIGNNVPPKCGQPAALPSPNSSTAVRLRFANAAEMILSLI